MAALFSWASINLNSGTATKEATGTRCAEKVGFGKRVKQEKIWRGPSPQKGNGRIGGERLLLLYKICWKTKMAPPRILASHPQIQPKFGRAKIVKLTAKIVHFHCPWVRTIDFAPPNFRDMNINVSIKQAKD